MRQEQLEHLMRRIAMSATVEPEIRAEAIMLIRDREAAEHVNHPKHYQVKPFVVTEVIDVIEGFNLNFNLGNSVKYILRSGSKENADEDLEKAIWCIERQLGKHKQDTGP